MAGLAIVLLALTPRLAALDTYVTIDESRWLQRAADFSLFLARGDARETFIIGHPGVTTMWTALLGMGPQRAQQFSSREDRTDATRRDGYFDALQAARRPFVLLAAASVGLITLLAWRLIGAGPAMLGGMLLALEPFLVAHARVVHLDSGLTVYMTVSLLAALIYWQRGGGAGYLLLSSVGAGLALLTKAPALFLLGFLPLLLLAPRARISARPRWPSSPQLLGLALWTSAAVAVCLLLWPALRADSFGTLQQVAQFTERVGGGEHDNFFLGDVREDPGPLFYPLALLFRLSPLTLLGLLLAVGSWRWLRPEQRRVGSILALYCLGFGLMMSLAPKKFDRYMLPVFPVLGLLAGLGVWTALRTILRSVGSVGSAPARGPWSQAVSAGFLVSLLALQAAPLLAVHPYYLAYYNPLLGGGPMAQRTILIGWGEGLDQAARYLNAQSSPLGAPTVATSYHRVLQAHLEGSALPLERVRMADFVVPYVNTLQRRADSDVLLPFLESAPPEHAVWINGIEYARVYRGPHYPLGGPVNASFDGRVTLLEFLAAPGARAVNAGDEIQTLLRWDRVSDGREQAALLLLDQAGRVVVQDQRPLGADGPDQLGRPGEIHRLTVPPRTAAGEHLLGVRVIDPSARASLPVAGDSQASVDTAVLRTIVVE